MRLTVRGARVVTPEGERALDLSVEAGKIVALGAGLQADRTIDADGLTLLPGFLDVHVHGGGGADFMDATPEALETICRIHAAHGTTGLLATTITHRRSAVDAALRNVRENPRPVVLGVHLEGPYISPEKPGAQPKEFVRDYDETEFASWLAFDAIRRITLAPERPGAAELCAACLASKIALSFGHSGASAAQLRAALDRAGAADATHLFNAMNGIHHRDPGPIPIFLTDPRCYVELIADGHHVAPEVVAVAVRAKGIDKVLAITDAMAGAGAPDGAYGLGGHEATVKDGKATLADGTLAGSVLTMDAAARNLRDWCGLSWTEIARVTSTNAAERHGWTNKGRIAVGADADFVLVDDSLAVHSTWLGGDDLASPSGESY